MGDIDSCLDPFKHLPYFNPLYTTILRQQMQFLTEQLSRHAGEESLVLTTNLFTGTISSLTSTHGTGFLDNRPDLKKHFTAHCSKNKISYDEAQKGKRVNLGHHISAASAVTMSKRRKYTPENFSTNQKSPNLEIEDVRSLISVEDVKNISLTKFLDDGKQNEKTCENEIVIEGLPKDGNEDIIDTNTESDIQGALPAVNQEEVIVIEIGDPDDFKDQIEDVSNFNKHTQNGNLIHDRSEDESTSEWNDANTSSASIVCRSEDSDSWFVVENDSVVDGKPDQNDSSVKCSSDDYLSTESSGFIKSVKSETVAANQDKPIPFSSSLSRKINQNSKRPIQYLANTSTNLGKYHCRYCSNVYTAFSSRKRHERKHTGDYPYVCEICDQRFYRKDDLNVHTVSHKLGKVKHYGCPTCDKKFGVKKQLAIHVHRYHPEIMLKHD